jgi:hypothetical protein
MAEYHHHASFCCHKKLLTIDEEFFNLQRETQQTIILDYDEAYKLYQLLHTLLFALQRDEAAL